jgi:PAS domain S-box-containing protein
MTSDGPAAASAADILGAIGQAVVVTDLDGTVVYWNHVAEELYQWTAEEAIGRRARDLVEPAAGAQFAGDVRGRVLAGETWQGGFGVRRKDGSGFSVLATVSALDRDGVVAGMVTVSTNLGAALRPLLERSTDAAVVLRSDAVVTYASPAVAQVLGWEESIVGASIVGYLHPDDRPALASFMEEVVRHPGAHPALDLRLLTQKGWVWCEASLTNLLDDPVLRGVVCNLRISHHRLAFESMERQVDQLNTALRSRVAIEQAKGFLTARHGLLPDEAFERLRRYSRNNHVAIHEVSRQVVARELELPL